VTGDPIPLILALRKGDRKAALKAALEAYVPGDVEPELVSMIWSPDLSVQNRLVTPSPEARRTVFYVENQGSDDWGFTGEADPIVVRRDGTVERESLSGFLIQLVLFERSMAGPFHAAGQLSEDAWEAAIGQLMAVPLAAWRWPMDPTRFYVGDGITAHLTQEPDGSAWLFASAFTADRLDFLRGLAGDWARLD
jgi:hypothetical protein